MEEQKEATFGSTIRAFAFDGDETKFRSWEGKTIALAGSKGFLLALTKAPTATGLTAEEFENGEVVVLGALLTGGDVDATEHLFVLLRRLVRLRLRRTGSTAHVRPLGLTLLLAARIKPTL
ncbi:hypothetical protein MHU86_25630 [Fragilaria crotonensis]|nr:hypothetical protein MHU86_25630 [Fragilaria crotonensis]